ncbi:putative Zn-binding protein involved in type VI secretion [Kitasatospora sp. MAP12-15]|uniref:PAAR domain-containing protein n=1 Tax=unclassified Kitasatospora TaxID=2633591 RepID=UPI0024752EB1|nr:PAAR domain-containing protein [Kitasatospora sp. MAP12-44]MDH6108475.1 putative Zn-binding protein involved in type VI secretion [Kitasatospora sp. MAP12-44]
MPPAARTGDSTDHGGVITLAPPGAVAVETVLIGGRPAAVVGSLHACVPHVELGPANLVMPSLAAASGGVVLIGGLPAARLGDETACGATIVTGAFNVLIGGIA